MYLKLSNVSNSTIINEDWFAVYCNSWMHLFKSVQCVQELDLSFICTIGFETIIG